MNKKAQSTIEFTFVLIVIFFMVYGLIRIFRWAGMDLANRRYWQESVMWGTSQGGDPASQLSAGDFYQPMSAIYHGSITNGS